MKTKNSKFIENMLKEHVLLLVFQNNMRKMQEVLQSYLRYQFERYALTSILIRLGRVNPMQLTSKSRFCTMLVQRMLCMKGQRDLQHVLTHMKSILSRRRNFNKLAATCVATLEGHSKSVISVEFHPTAPLLATGSWDNTAKLWRLSSDNSSATCVETLKDNKWISDVSFHPTEPVIAVGSYNNIVNILC